MTEILQIYHLITIFQSDVAVTHGIGCAILFLLPPILF